MKTERISKTNWIFNPFIVFGGGKALAIGLAVIILAALIGVPVNACFDGVMDLHIQHPMPVWKLVLCNISNWVVVSVILLVIGKVFSKSGSRAIDVIGTQALARFPNVFSALIILLFLIPGFKSTAAAGIIVGFFASVSVVWMVILMVNAYSISFDLKGKRMIITAVIGLVGAEIISKYIFMAILKI